MPAFSLGESLAERGLRPQARLQPITRQKGYQHTTCAELQGANAADIKLLTSPRKIIAPYTVGDKTMQQDIGSAELM